MKKYCWTKKEVEGSIDECDKIGHFQQVVYSVHGKALTQICFICDVVRTTYAY